ncbi:MAG: CoA transferase [Aureispira sp.]|nr:CoA transferase [Aureispira sp.]
MEKIFEDLKVIELASVLAGPAVGLFLAELGANVIKVENQRTGGDVTRTWRLPKESNEAPVSAYYCAVNWNKEVVFLNLATTEDQAKVHEWVKEADIVVANFKSSSAKKMQMDQETLRAINPALIYANISGFGEESKRVAFDVVLQAESGFMYMNGQPDGPATKMPVALIDVLAAHQLKQGILVALIQRMKTGKGSYVSVSLLDAAIASLANQATNWLMGEHIPQRMGSLHPNIAPYGETFLTKDGEELVLAIGNDKQFVGLCKFLGCPELATNPNYVSNAQRVKHRVELTVELKKAFLTVEAAWLLAQCHENYVPIGQIKNIKQVFEQASAQALLLEETLEGKWPTQRVKTAAFKIQ